MIDQPNAVATSKTAQTWKTIHTKHTLSHPNKANMEWWLHGQTIFGDLGGLKFPDICLTGEEQPRKNLTQETCPDRGSNPGPLRYKRTCYHLLHSGGRIYSYKASYIADTKFRSNSLSHFLIFKKMHRMKKVILHNFGLLHFCATTNNWLKKEKIDPPELYPLNILKLNVAHNLLLYSYTVCKGNKCHHFNSRRGRLKGPKNIRIYGV